MALNQVPVIVVNSDSDSECYEKFSFSEAALSFKDGSYPDIISVSSLEEIPPANRLRQNTTISLRHTSDVLTRSSVEDVLPETTQSSNRAISLGSSSSYFEISTSSVEEIDALKLKKENIAHEVKYNKRHIEDICLCCGEFEIHTQHPLFHGGMCAPCAEKFLERFFLCDDDGSQADCTICCWGKSLMMCDDSKCHRCFCEECMNILVHPGYAKEIKETNPWICFMCVSQDVYGLLKRRTKWRSELKHFYDQESDLSNTWIYQPLTPWERKSIQVLSVFDNITEELKNLGFLGKRKGNGHLKYVDDITNVTRIHIQEWGPFDFIFGSTPPVAKDYRHPSAWYFYQFFRILQYGNPTEERSKPFFWLFVDNIVLDEDVRDTASRYFEMEAVLRCKQDDGNVLNAVHVWSNIPSVNSKYSASALNMDLSFLAEEIRRTRIFSQRPATMIRDFFVPLKEYFRAFS